VGVALPLMSIAACGLPSAGLRATTRAGSLPAIVNTKKKLPVLCGLRLFWTRDLPKKMDKVKLLLAPSRSG
jgi:hypothetical protein